MDKYTFTFNGIDLYTKYGILAAKIRRRLIPKKRSRKVVVPEKSGAIDFGSDDYDESEVEIKCITLRVLTGDEIRQLAYDLSGKGEIRTFLEPDRYYVGELFDTSVVDYIGTVGNRFSLPFICEPFAHGEQVTENFTNNSRLQYNGTAKTPARIIIKNTSGHTIEGLNITMRKAVN